MTDEEPKSKKEEKALSVLEMARQQEQNLIGLNERLEKNIEELKQLKAEDILSGRVSQPQETKPIEISPREYAERALRNQI